MPNDRNNDYETAYYNAEEVRRQSAAGGPKKKKEKSKRANQRLALYLACVVLGLLIGYIVLLFINPNGGYRLAAVQRPVLAEQGLCRGQDHRGQG